MRSKCAVVIVYDGKPIKGEDHRIIAEALMNGTDVVLNGETIEVYGLDSNDIARGIAIKAVANEVFYPNSTPIESEFDAAARFIHENFANSISKGITEFAANISTVYVSIKLRGFSQPLEKEVRLIQAVELLAQDGAFTAISPNARRKYHITKSVVDTIKEMYDSICRGQIVGM